MDRRAPPFAYGEWSYSRGHNADFCSQMCSRGKWAMRSWQQLHNNRSPIFLKCEQVRMIVWCFMVFQARWLGKPQMFDILEWSKTVSVHAQAWCGDVTDRSLREKF